MNNIEITATYFRRPNGRREEIIVKNVRPEAAQYLADHDIKVSMEDDTITGGFVVYLDDGTMLDDDETPDEIIIISGAKSCEDCLDEGVELLKKRQNHVA